MYQQQSISFGGAILAWAGGLAASLIFLSAAAGQTATFDLSFDNSFKVNIRDVHAGDLPAETALVEAFMLDLRDFKGEPFSAVGFCTEFEEFAVGGTNTNYSFDALEGISSGRAGEAGTASTGIPIGGIGAERAGRVRYLFDKHYKGTSLDDWARSTNNPDTLAFQLAVWEITHDSDLDLDPTDGYFWIDPSSNNGRRRQNTLALAQTYLDEIAALGIGASYQSAVWEVLALEQLGSPGDQDLLFAAPLQTIPEPAAATLSLLGAGLLISRRRRDPHRRHPSSRSPA